MPMHVRDHFRFLHKLHHPNLKPRLHHIIRDHVNAQALFSPEPVHHFEHLKDQVVLSQIITILEHKLELLFIHFFLFW